MRALGLKSTLGLSVALAFAAAGCATAPVSVAVLAPPPPAALPAPPTLEGAWSLAMLRDAPAGTKISATLKIAADHAEGATQCRAWTAAAPNYGMDLRFESMNTQEQACDDQMKAAEARYLDALAAVRTVQMRSGYLVLMDERGRERLYFARGG